MALNCIQVIFLVVVSSLFCVAAQKVEGDTTCVNNLIEWCENMINNNNFYGNFMTSDYSSSGERQTIHCMSSNRGTNCSINNSLWFACRSDGSVTYKNFLLQKNSSSGSDDEICDAAKKASNMFSYNKEEVEAAIRSGRRTYERAMSNLNTSMDNLHRTLSRPCFPFCGGSPFGRGFPFNR